MKHWLFALLLLPGLALATTPVKAPRVSMETNFGTLVVELDPVHAPQSVSNFLAYVRDGSYNGSLFHRVIPGFVVQGGGYNGQYQPLPTHSPVKNESSNGLSNVRGSLAMARTQDPDSATRQFYFNLQNNSPLDGSSGQAGYTVFGKVVSGLEVLDKIAAQPTGDSPQIGASDVPQTPIVLQKVTIQP